MEVGFYDANGADITAEDIEAMVSSFAPVPLDIDHRPTLLDGKLGQLVEVTFSSDKRTLFGRVELPEWLDKALSDVEKKVSLTLDATKRKIQKLALTTNPVVPDAVLFSHAPTSPEDEMTKDEIQDAVASALTALGFKKKEVEEKPVTVDFSQTDEYKAMKEAAEKAENRAKELEAESIKNRAANFVELQFSLGKITSEEEKTRLQLRAERAIKDDTRDIKESIQFSKDNPSRFDMLKEEFDKTAPAGLSEELLESAKILNFSEDASRQQDDAEVKERRERMLAASTLVKKGEDK